MFYLARRVDWLTLANGKRATPPGGGPPPDEDRADRAASEAPSCLAAASAVKAPLGTGAPLMRRKGRWDWGWVWDALHGWHLVSRLWNSYRSRRVATSSGQIRHEMSSSGSESGKMIHKLWITVQRRLGPCQEPADAYWRLGWRGSHSKVSRWLYSNLKRTKDSHFQGPECCISCGCTCQHSSTMFRTWRTWNTRREGSYPSNG